MLLCLFIYFLLQDLDLKQRCLMNYVVFTELLKNNWSTNTRNLSPDSNFQQVEQLKLINKNEKFKKIQTQIKGIWTQWEPAGATCKVFLLANLKYLNSSSPSPSPHKNIPSLFYDVRIAVEIFVEPSTLHLALGVGRLGKWYSRRGVQLL